MALSLSNKVLLLRISVPGLAACYKLSLQQAELAVLSSIVLLSIVLSMASACSWASEALSSFRMMAEKLSYIERRLDSLGASAADSLRHLTEAIWQYDPEVGNSQVLKRWILRSRDEWMLRRSASSWLYLSMAAELQVRHELIYKKLTEQAH